MMYPSSRGIKDHVPELVRNKKSSYHQTRSHFIRWCADVWYQQLITHFSNELQHLLLNFIVVHSCCRGSCCRQLTPCSMILPPSSLPQPTARFTCTYPFMQSCCHLVVRWSAQIKWFLLSGALNVVHSSVLPTTLLSSFQWVSHQPPFSARLLEVRVASLRRHL